jgi:hypothetical protein
MNNKIKTESWAIIILIVSFSYILILVFLSEGLYGDTDSITHYEFARWAFNHPYHFVDHWAKPLYTSLCAPFAQFGYRGALVFNILCGVLSSWLIFRIARELNLRYALVAIPFALFAPIYMVTMMTCLTEILFGLVLVAAIYAFLKEKCILSAVIISFIPFARTEGLLFLAIFAGAFLLKKHYKAIPFLASGFIIFSLAGVFHYKNFFWFFNAMPYGLKGSELYGSGKFLYYIGRFDIIMGWPLIILAGLGLAGMLIGLIKSPKIELSTSWITKYYLVTGSFFAFLFLHSLLWWQGMMSVLASDRFMACIMPLGGLLALYGLNLLTSLLNSKVYLKGIFIAVITGLVLWMPFYIYDIPEPLLKQDKVMKDTAGALKNMGFKNKILLYFDPKLPFFLNEDPEDRSVFSYPMPPGKKPEQMIADNSLFVWDAQFAEGENKLLLDDVLKNPYFRLIDGFVPDKDFRNSNGQNYMSLIFQKVPLRKVQNEWKMLNTQDFESPQSVQSPDYISDSVAYSGNRSMMLNPSCPYSPAMKYKLTDLFTDKKVIVRGSVRINSPFGAKPDKILLILSVENEAGKFSRYLSKAASYYKTEQGKWFEISIVTPILTDYPENGKLGLYAWNQGKEEIFVDNLVLEYIKVY